MANGTLNNIDVSKGLTDEEMAQLEAEQNQSTGLTDAEMAQLEAKSAPQNPTFLPNKSKVDELIANRPDSVKSLIDELKYNPSITKEPLQALLHPATAMLKLAAVPFQRLESGAANMDLALQAGKPQEAIGGLIQGLSGQKNAQLGDLIRTTGFGGGANEAIASTTGLLGSVGLSGGGSSAVALEKFLTTKAPESILNTISKTRDYSANKVNAIRQSFWNSYAPKEWKAYGDAIESLPTKSAGHIDGASAIPSLEKTLANRGLLNQEGQVVKVGASPEDLKLIKAYDNMYKKFSDSPDGKIPMKDVVDIYKELKGKFSAKPSSAQRANVKNANDFFNSFSDQINSDVFKVANARYRGFKQNEQMIHEAIDLYAPSMKTAKGERFLMGGALNATTQGRKTASMITEVTGQKLNAARAMSTISNIPILKTITRIR